MRNLNAVLSEGMLPMSTPLSPNAAGSLGLSWELSQIVLKHVAECTGELMGALAARGVLPGAEVPTLEPEEHSGPLPEAVANALHAANKPGARTFTAGQARAAVARNRLVAALEARGLNQQDLAAKVGKSPAVVSRVLRNPERSRVTTLRQLADALDVNLGDILSDA
jgi:DNA-binding Xre family transcriptional regulator